jgi:hypothetical protein
MTNHVMKDVLTTSAHLHQNGKNEEINQDTGTESPRTSLCQEKRIEFKGFINMSAGISMVGIQMVVKEPS